MDVKHHRIRCPYCVFGGATIEVKVEGKAFVQADIGTPVQCDRCRRPFKIRPRVKFVGRRIEETS